jgi:hypothetical protein
MQLQLQFQLRNSHVIIEFDHHEQQRRRRMARQSRNTDVAAKEWQRIAISCNIAQGHG